MTQPDATPARARRRRSAMRGRTIRAAAFLANVVLATMALSGCSGSSEASDVVHITVGYQSKTINTVTAGTLLRAKGYFEQRLEEAGKQTGKTYEVTWKDYDTGAPITTGMVAGDIDIGSMGDYPMLINGSKTAAFDDARTELIGATGYSLSGALNAIVVPESSSLTSVGDLDGTTVSASEGSAGHGMLLRALDQAGVDASNVTVANQDPPVGASALESGDVDAMSQFVAWPGLLVYQGDANLLFDGADVDFPTWHGIVARAEFTSDHPEVTKAFLQSVIDATHYLHKHPLEAAETVAKDSGLPAEVVYLYNGRNGIATFDPTLKAPLIDALSDDIPFLESQEIITEDSLNLDDFVNDEYLREVYGPSYGQDVESTANPAAITGTDPVCHTEVTDPSTAGEVWLANRPDTTPAATPTCLLRQLAQAESQGQRVRAAYVPDATSGTRWFADASIWVRDPAAPDLERFKPFTTSTHADEYVEQHPGSTIVDFESAISQA
jgi:NitT/TauT family transport system substrate-binding protein